MGYGQYSQETRPSTPRFSSAVEAPKKRMRHVFDNPAHVWAHPLAKDGSGFKQDNARVAGGNFYFKTSSDGTRVIYSYRDSYPIGARFTHGKKTIFMLRAGKPYSVTTAGHMNATRQAVPDKDNNVEVFTVSAMVDNYSHCKPGQHEHAENIRWYLTEIADAIERHGKSRSSSNIKGTLREATDLTAELKRYVKVFKLKSPELPTLPKIDQAKLAQIIVKESQREARASLKRELERKEYEARHQAEVAAWMASSDACKHIGENGEPIHSFMHRWTCEEQRKREDWEAKKPELIAAWRRGDDVRLQFSYSEPALLRVIGDTVETSQHVTVPITGHAGAARLFHFLKAVKDAGRTYQRNGHTEHIGNFTVTSFDGELMVAGCHRIQWAEILSISEVVLAIAAESELS
jgi:hypothetical protein